MFFIYRDVLNLDFEVIRGFVDNSIRSLNSKLKNQQILGFSKSVALSKPANKVRDILYKQSFALTEFTNIHRDTYEYLLTFL